MKLRKANERGFFDHGWLKTYHSFSFADYHSEEWTNFHGLRVINEDFIGEGEGFSTHGHKNMEIFTYVLKGELAHKDSMGNGSIIKAGDFQYMSAAKGVLHSEYNPSQDQPVHLLQIWIHPRAPGGEPRYGQLALTPSELTGKWRKVVTPDEDKTVRESILHSRASATIHVGKFSKGEEIKILSRPGVSHYIHCTAGELEVYTKNKNRADQKVLLKTGDAGAWENEPDDILGSAFSDLCHLLWFEFSV